MVFEALQSARVRERVPDVQEADQPGQGQRGGIPHQALPEYPKSLREGRKT